MSRIGINGNLRLAYDDMGLMFGFILTALATAYLVWSAYRRPSRRSVAWALTALLATPQMIQRLDLGHSLNVGSFSIPLAVATALALTGAASRIEFRFGAPLARGIAWTTAWVLVIVLVGQSLAGMPQSPPTVTHGSRVLPVVHTQEKRAIARLLRRVNARVPVGSKVFVGARDMSVPTLNDMRLYHLLPEYDAFAYNLELPPPRAVGSDLTDDLRQADALVLLDVPGSWGRTMVPFVPRGDTVANDVVSKNFCIAERVHPYRLYLRCGPKG